MGKIASQFKDRPKYKFTWWAMWFGLAILFLPMGLGIFASIIRPYIDKVLSENVGQIVGYGFGFFAVAISLLAIVTSFVAYKKGERSWVAWVGLIPAMLLLLFWIFMIIGEALFQH